MALSFRSRGNTEGEKLAEKADKSARIRPRWKQQKVGNRDAKADLRLRTIERSDRVIPKLNGLSPRATERRRQKKGTESAHDAG